MHVLLSNRSSSCSSLPASEHLASSTLGAMPAPPLEDPRSRSPPRAEPAPKPAPKKDAKKKNKKKKEGTAHSGSEASLHGVAEGPPPGGAAS
eukprot:8741685-Alexandrium_andersonii.AAC.1